jgi:hypothetical protein
MEIAALITWLAELDKPLYDYEEIIFDALVTQNGNKHLWIKKATGLGVSEFMLRFMAWLCIKDNSLSDFNSCKTVCWLISFLLPLLPSNQIFQKQNDIFHQ